MVWNGIVVDCKTDWVRVSISNVLLLLLLGLECDMRNIYHILFYCFPLFFFYFFFAISSDDNEDIVVFFPVGFKRTEIMNVFFCN